MQLQTKKYQLMIGAKRGRWRTNRGIEPADKDFAMVKPKVLNRDNGACVYCHIKMKGMHVHHYNDIHEDNRPENLVTVDDLCHSVNHVGLLGKSGVIVYMPGISQIDISHLFRTIAVAISFGGDIGKQAQKLADFLINRLREPVGSIFGTYSPADFGNALIALSDEDYAARSTALKDVRVLFKPETLTGLAARSREAVYNNLPPDTWGRIYEDFLKRDDA